MELDQVSVILPTYNRSQMLGGAIETVLAQTYRNFELLIIDDGSTDKTKEIIQRYNDKRIRYIWQENSGSPAGARNTGLKMVKGKYIAFLDSDDLWFSSKLEKQVEFLNKNDEILLVATNFIVFSNSGVFIKDITLSRNIRVSFHQLINRNMIINSSVILRKEIADVIGLQDENLSSMEDYDYWLRILNFKDKSIVILKDQLTKFRKHDMQTHFSISPCDKYKKFKYVYSKYKKLDYPQIKLNLRRLLYNCLIQKKKEKIFNNILKIPQILKDTNVKLNDKILLVFKYFDVKYFNFILNNKIFGLFFGYIKIITYKLIKRLII